MAHIIRSGVRPLAKSLNQANQVSVSSARGFLWFGKDKVRFPKDIDHATGEERIIRLAQQAGLEDPFDIKAAVRGPGTKDNPNIVQTFEESRMIACKCEEDSSSLKYMWVDLGDPKRCECGYWFKAVPARKFWEEFGDK